jgi:hypothetical protein
MLRIILNICIIILKLNKVKEYLLIYPFIQLLHLFQRLIITFKKII